MSDAIALNQTTLLWALFAVMAFIGFRRGVQSEGITLAGVLAATVVFTNDAMGGKIIAIINKVPKIINILLSAEENGDTLGLGSLKLINTPDERLIFSTGFFLIAVAIFYLAGSNFGGQAYSRIHRLLGGVLGGANGLLITISLTTFAQQHLSRHPQAEPVTITLPGLQMLPNTSPGSLIQYAPLVFLGTLVLVTIFAVTSWGKAKT
ncbi:MAG: hypothetical protein HYX88_02865 [Chloroflexi bacterium]|nr:hypothetical protein [Chloroflexota bacterium]